jgi:hypothetical protein
VYLLKKMYLKDILCSTWNFLYLYLCFYCVFFVGMIYLSPVISRP